MHGARLDNRDLVTWPSVTALHGASEVKKLVSVSRTSTSMAGTREETLECVSCIHYPVQFKGMNETQVQALIDSGSEVNAMTLIYVSRLGF